MANSETISKASIRGLDDTYVPSAGYGIDRALFTNEVGVNLDTLYKTVQKTPEVVACIQAITEDIMADEWKYIGGKKPIADVDDFALQSKFYKILTNAIYDLLITGNAYILKLSVRESEVKSLFSKLTKGLASDLQVGFRKKTRVLIQNLTKPKDLQVLKSSTVSINYDETGKVESYEQLVQSERRTYLPEDIIHLSLVNVGGQPYGFSPLEPLLSDVATLILAKEYAGKYFENDGVPNFLFKMPEDNPDSRNYTLLKKELKELKKKEEKFRNLVLTGKVDVEQLQKFNKDMEYAKLIQHFTQIILIGYGVPSHRINFTLTDKQVGSQINRAYEGYYKKISFMQKIIEIMLNTELFHRYWKVKLKFNRSYKIDEMREAQIIQILTQVGAVTIEEARDMMGLDPEIPKGTMPNATGDNMGIDFNADQRTQQGQDNNPKSPDSKMDNKTKDFVEELSLLKKNYENKFIEEKVMLRQELERKREELDKEKEGIKEQGKSQLDLQKANLEKEYIARLNAIELQMKKDLNVEKAKLMKETKPQVIKVKSMPDKDLKKMYKQVMSGVKKLNSEKTFGDVVEINHVQFEIIVERYGGFGKAKVLYKEDDNEFRLYFNDGTWKYCTIYSKKGLNVERFRVEVLPFALRIG